ncbi:nicotinamide N-methyltransferase-like [Mixophyes fleayi]|uniref:nicotinamide N-methyltransferase-like n=1 Tax=Mixophyes fleayi TaxID=3061075 RepID=UPI003F4E2243
MDILQNIQGPNIPGSRQAATQLKIQVAATSRSFKKDHVKGKSLIEIGAGPSIHHILPACVNFEEIYLTDSLQENLQEIEKWLTDSSEAFDWSPYLKYVCHLQSTGRYIVRSKAEKLRRNVSLMKCDVTKTNPLQPKSLTLMNCVLAVACLTSACKTTRDFKTAVKNIVSLINPGGHLVLSDYCGVSYYLIGEAKFPRMSLDGNIVKEAVAESGCEIAEFKMFTNFQIPEGIFDCKNLFCLLARKL